MQALNSSFAIPIKLITELNATFVVASDQRLQNSAANGEFLLPQVVATEMHKIERIKDNGMRPPLHC